MLRMRIVSAIRRVRDLFIIGALDEEEAGFDDASLLAKLMAKG
jgi:hypothetical protein